MSLLARLTKAPLLGAIALYRLTLSPFVGTDCRYLPTCSGYAREAIETNGAWKGGWLTPVPDLRAEHHPFAPWRYGRWRTNPGDERAVSG